MNFDEILTQANHFRNSLGQAKNLLDKKTVEVSGGKGVVTVIITGSGIIKEIRLASEAMNLLGKDELEATLTATVNEAYSRSKKLAAGIMFEITGFDPNSFSEMF